MKTEIGRWPKILLLIFSSLGLLDAGYLTVNYLSGQTPFCVIEGCEVVLTSRFAEIFGIPTSFFGVLFYAAVFCLSFFIQKRPAVLALLALSSVGLAISFLLVYIQIYLIQAICLYCLASALLVSLIFLTAIYLSSKKNSPRVVDPA